MLATLKWFFAALLVLVAVSPVNAQPQPGTVQIIITGRVGGACPSISEQFRDDAWPSNQPFFYTQMTGCTTGVKIIAYDDQTDIPFIRLTNTNATTNSCVVAIGDYPLCSSAVITPRGRNFEGIVTEGFTSQLMGGINGTLPAASRSPRFAVSEWTETWAAYFPHSELRQRQASVRSLI